MTLNNFFASRSFHKKRKLLKSSQDQWNSEGEKKASSIQLNFVNSHNMKALAVINLGKLVFIILPSKDMKVNPLNAKVAII